MKSPRIPRAIYVTYYLFLFIVLIFAFAIRKEYETRHPQTTSVPAGVAVEPYGGAIYWVTAQK